MRTSNIFGLGIGVFVALTLIFSSLGSFYTIDQGARGVVLRNGAFTGISDPGLGFKMPWVDSVVEISVQSHSITYDKIEAYSRDQQPAVIRLSLNYRIPADQVEKVYEEYGGADAMVSRLLERKMFDQFKTVFGSFRAADAISDRSRLNIEFLTALKNSITGPVMVESVQIEDISFTDAYESGIEAKQLAEVQVATLAQSVAQAKQTALITVTDAQAKADAVVAAAKAEGEAVKIRGAAEASAIDAKGKALRDNPGLVSLIAAEKWTGVLPTTMVPNSTVPFLDLLK
ncbi:MAG: prohibitin family protein [Undibacterium sp.]